jgi:hypothetical protein
MIGSTQRYCTIESGTHLDRVKNLVQSKGLNLLVSVPRGGKEDGERLTGKLLKGNQDELLFLPEGEPDRQAAQPWTVIAAWMAAEQPLTVAGAA